MSSLVSKRTDFWLLGGASLLVWLALFCIRIFSSDSLGLSATTGGWVDYLFIFTVLTSFPHFSLSYKLAYSRGPGLIKKHPFRLIGLPISLIASAWIAASHFDQRIALEAPWVQSTHALLNLLGARVDLTLYENVGGLMISLGLFIMLTAVGWHFGKQAFGAMMVYARYDHYSLSTKQRWIIKYSLLSVWWYRFMSSNTYVQEPILGFRPFSLVLPVWPATIMSYVMAAGVLGFILLVLSENLSERGQRPSLNFLTPWIAFFIWWLPISGMNPYYALLVPAFHGLQYLPFVYKQDTARGARWWVTYALGILAGFGILRGIPFAVELLGVKDSVLPPTFFAAVCFLTLNLHHYFIDSAIWKFKDSSVQSRLLGEQPA